MMTILLWADAIVVQACCSPFILLGHCPQPPCSFAMREVAGDAPTPFSMIEQGALFDAHSAITLGRHNCPFARDSDREKVAVFSIRGRNMVLRPTFRQQPAEGRNAMYDVCQLATATLAIAFTALLLVTGQRFIEYRLQHEAMTPRVAIATLPP